MKACYHGRGAAISWEQAGNYVIFKNFLLDISRQARCSLGLLFRSLQMNAFACQQLSCSLHCIRGKEKKGQEKKQNYFGDFGIVKHSETFILDSFQKLIIFKI